MSSKCNWCCKEYNGKGFIGCCCEMCYKEKEKNGTDNK